jgi:hypothetical protein
MTVTTSSKTKQESRQGRLERLESEEQEQLGGHGFENPRGLEPPCQSRADPEVVILPREVLRMKLLVNRQM